MKKNIVQLIFVALLLTVTSMACKKDQNVTEVILDQSAITLAIEETVFLQATVLPNTATNKAVTWISNNPDIASVENGLVKANATGTAIITVTTQDGNKTAFCTVTVLSLSAPTLINVKGGTFTMGCTGEDCFSWELPSHQVTLSDYKISKYPVTQAQWEAIMGSNPSFYKGDSLPVETVNWTEVQDFIKKLNIVTSRNYRLPTEAEWEYACRGGTNSAQYTYSGSNNVDEVAWYKENSNSKTHPVGKKTPNKLGIYDMSGNVWEWCSDWYASYTNSPKTNPTGPQEGTLRVIRGGSWSNEAKRCSVSNRGTADPESGHSGLGFRLVSQ